ncbi:hypothetical protein AB0E56_11165 [Microbacterium sp. NPDC028030]|uniref:hypothetical protein n=1 Tax=Microbacterium sp. NPDC028030 TaxID=3155124 RepID=UPI0033C6950F
MTDLADLIPPHDPSEDTLAAVGGMALDAIPILGPLAGRALDHALAARERERRHEFDIGVVSALQQLAERSDTALTLADVVNSDEFLATLARVQREAAETASHTKRRRLARAAVSALDPSAPPRAERADFLRLIIELEDLHIWLLAFFADPRAWLDAHDLAHVYENSGLGSSPGVALEAALNYHDMTFSVSIEAALDDLEGRGLASAQLRTFMAQGGMVQPRASARGLALLQYLDEGNPAEAEPPPAG